MKLFSMAACLASATLLAAAAAAPAQAAQPTIDIHWAVTGTFDDGSTLSGFFEIDQFGSIFDWDLTTSDGEGFDGFDYIRTLKSVANSGGDNSETAVAFKKTQDSFFRLGFTQSLFELSDNNPIEVGGEVSPSFECVDSFSCFLNDGHGTSRHLVSGSAVGTLTSISGEGGGGSGAPEPAAWAMMLVGFGGIGAALRGARRRTAPAFH